LRLRERNRGWLGSRGQRHRHAGGLDSKAAGNRASNTARERRDQAHRAGEAPPGAKRAQALFRLERRPAGDRAQFQALSSSDEQDRRPLGRRSGVPPRLLLMKRNRNAGVGAAVARSEALAQPIHTANMFWTRTPIGTQPVRSATIAT